jgi:translation elongation factor EF-G
MILEAVSLVSITVPVELLVSVEATVTSYGGQVVRSEMPSQTIRANLPASRADDLISELLRISDGHAKISIVSAGFRPRPSPPDTVEQWVARTS